MLREFHGRLARCIDDRSAENQPRSCSSQHGSVITIRPLIGPAIGDSISSPIVLSRKRKVRIWSGFGLNPLQGVRALSVMALNRSKQRNVPTPKLIGELRKTLAAFDAG